MKRRVWYVSGTRADFGLMEATLHEIAAHSELEIGILVTGMHLDPAFGETVKEIEASGLPIVCRKVAGTGTVDGAGMAFGIARMIEGFTEAMSEGRPDVLLLLGDRGEMLAGAIAAIHLDIPIAHIHGGERSGTVDEPVRHAISKLSHIHLAATDDAAQRLRKLGEREDLIFVVGAPGLVGLREAATESRAALADSVGFDPTLPIALFIYHPVLQEMELGAEVASRALEALASRGIQTVALMPNSDGGWQPIRDALHQRMHQPGFHLATHLPRRCFVSWMAQADVMVGNSSAGIIEAASFGTPVINIGQRQHLRERNANTLDTTAEPSDIGNAIDEALSGGRFPCENRYGDGHTAQRITALLATIGLSGITAKSNAY